jgi:hypothetical protein
MNWSTSLTAYVPKKVIEPSGTALVSSGVCWLQTRESQDGDHQHETSVVRGASGIGAERIGRPAALMSRLKPKFRFSEFALGPKPMLRKLSEHLFGVKPHSAEEQICFSAGLETRPRLTRQIPKLAKTTSESGLKERLSVY